MDPATLARHALEALKRPLTLKEALSSVADFRIDRMKKFPLYEILMIAVCAMIDGAKGPTDFERFGKAKLRLLKKFLPLRNGIPSHDTFRRVLGKIDPKRFNAATVKWLESIADVTGDVISIDGKLLRRALTTDCKMPCIVPIGIVCQSGFGITHRGKGLRVIGRSPVPLPIDQRVAITKRLCH